MADLEEQEHAGTIASLEGLIESAGWQWFTEQVNKTWGDAACMGKITSALKELRPGDEDGERMTTLQIVAAQRQILALLRLPAERIAALTQQAQKPKGAFAALRRTGG